MVGDERDLVRVRTTTVEPAYLYRLNTSADDARRLLLIYLDADQPTCRSSRILSPVELTAARSTSCDTQTPREGSGGFNIRHILNGLVDGYLYYSGRIDRTLPFDELRRRSLINEAARAADGAADFSSRLGHPCRRSPTQTSQLARRRCRPHIRRAGRGFGAIICTRHQLFAAVDHGPGSSLPWRL